MNTNLTVHFLIAMLAIVNPVGKIPVWLDASRDQPRAARWRLAVLVSLTGGGLLVGSLWAGTHVLEWFSIDLASFRVGGGIFLLLTGLSMLRGEITSLKTDGEPAGDTPMRQAEARFNRIVIPMAVPLIAGPGSISTAIIYADQAGSWMQLLSMTGILVAVVGVTFGSLLVAPAADRVVGKTGLDVITRLFGLLLVAIAVQMMVTGLAELFPNWVEGPSPLDNDVSG